LTVGKAEFEARVLCFISCLPGENLNNLIK
jgi:hypothetical protein